MVPTEQVPHDLAVAAAAVRYKSDRKTNPDKNEAELIESMVAYYKRNLETRSFMLDLLSNNMELLGSGTLENYPVFYKTFLDMLEYEEGNGKYQHAPEEFSAAFKSITFAILTEAKELALELKMPLLTEPLISKCRF